MAAPADIRITTVTELCGIGAPLIFGQTPSPFGTICAVTLDRRLAALHFRDEDDPMEAIRKQWPEACFEEDNEGVGAAIEGLFAKPGHAPATEIVLVGTGFQCEVWQGLMDITIGTVETYSQVAARIGRPSSVRAVASAIARNPLAIVVPCHRVVPSSGGTGAYRWGKDRKKALLASEGAI